jgi:hypothetical protein
VNSLWPALLHCTTTAEARGAVQTLLQVNYEGVGGFKRLESLFHRQLGLLHPEPPFFLTPMTCLNGSHLVPGPPGNVFEI